MSLQGFHVHAHINTVNPCKYILSTFNILILTLMPNCQFASYRLLDCEFVINSVFMCIDVCLKQICLLYYVPCTRQYFLNNLL